jgi:predicted O-linked N-acetylglucosamine transferase (SPINDLY family)
MNRQQRRAAAARTSSPTSNSMFTAGLDHHRAGRLGDAFACYQQVLESNPNHAQAWHQVALLAHQAGRPELALEAAEKAVIRDERTPAFHNTLASLHLAGGRLEEAVAGYRRAVGLDPHYAEAHCNLGNALRESGRFPEAAACLKRALALMPELAQAWNNLGTVWPELNRLAAAVAAFQRAIRLLPAYAEAHNNLGVVLKDQGRVAEAAAAWRQALALRPDFASAHSNLLFGLCFLEGADPDEVFAEHLRFDRQQVRPRAGTPLPHAHVRDPDRRLRVGYVSPDFRRHPGGHFLLPILEHHDHSRFEVSCWFSNARSDDLTERFRGHADGWHACRGLSDEALAERIRAAGIDILVECAGHMLDSRLIMFGRKPAPVQVSFPLYPNTTGVSAIDYRIMDPYFGPPWADQWHSEKLVRLPDAHVCYRPSHPEIQPAPRPPCLDNGYITFGSFNNFGKVGAATVAAWAEILRAVPDSRLMLKWTGLGRGSDSWCLDRFAAHGIGGERLILANPSPDPYTPYRQLDLCLDPIGANGGTTTCDALWMGVPVVTLYGRTSFSRVGVCHLYNLDLPELITATPEGYIETATWLARDLAALAEIRRDLRQRFEASPLMDGARYTRHLEHAYRLMWQRWCAGEPPAAFTVPPS